MTKLMEWLCVFGAVFIVWAAMVTNMVENDFTKNYKNSILVSPFVFIGLFGLYAASVILYRVFTFNDCEIAAIELQKEIEDARKDLTTKGFKFD